MRLRYTEQAREHIGAIFGFVHERNPTAATQIIARIRLAAERLVQFPRMGHVGRVPGTHEWVCARSALHCRLPGDGPGRGTDPRRVSWCSGSRTIGPRLAALADIAKIAYRRLTTIGLVGHAPSKLQGAGGTGRPNRMRATERRGWRDGRGLCSRASWR
ncbi:MAG: type II toxin-antitoxin system RelE/ParE family toxin [Bradyrhizobium sp.]|uniref:type II toxin-antitoxin system RelE/ParE family toxin n=1 Tax=Bradyrhizobium sp. TaxID=376 RepID=UPI001E193CB1|nr:type II toxin-antitoxin system RelE/ParE family toxin [Bradyrhizobium sp.]